MFHFDIRKNENLGQFYIEQFKEIILKKRDSLAKSRTSYQMSNAGDPISYFLKTNLEAFKNTQKGLKEETWAIMKEHNFQIFQKTSGLILAEFMDEDGQRDELYDRDLFGAMVTAIASLGTEALDETFHDISMNAISGIKLSIYSGKFMRIIFVWRKSKYAYEKVKSLAVELLDYLEQDVEKIMKLHESAMQIVDLEEFI